MGLHLEESAKEGACPTSGSAQSLAHSQNVQDKSNTLLGTGHSVPATMDRTDAVTALMRAAYFKKR